MKNKLTIDVTEICMCFIKTLKVSEQGTAAESIACNLQSRWMGISLASVESLAYWSGGLFVSYSTSNANREGS